MTASRHLGRAMFDVRPHEGQRVLAMGGAMFAILAAHTIAETARDAMFLRAMPSRWLAVVYLGLAGLAVLAVLGNTALVRRLGRRRAMVSTLMVAAAGSTVFYAARPDAAGAFALYLWTGLLGTIIVVQFWMLAGTTFTSAEAKRLYGMIAAMGAVGALAGAVVAASLLQVLEVEHLLPAAAGFYVLAGALLAREPAVLAHVTPEAAAREREPDRTARAPGAPARPVRLREHPYLRRLTVLVMIATCAALISDFLLKSAAVTRFSPGVLPHFFAHYNGAVAAMSLALQLVGASWLLRRAGVLGAAMILPASLLVGGTAILASASAFAAVVVTKGADASLRFSVNRVATEVLWMPVSDADRAAVREPLDSVITRVVQAATAAALLGLGLAGLATPGVLAGIVVALAALWLGVASGIRPIYLAQLRTALTRPSFEVEHELELELASNEARAIVRAPDARFLPFLIARIGTRHHRVRLDRSRLVAELRHHLGEHFRLLGLAVAMDADPDPRDSAKLVRDLLRDRASQASERVLLVLQSLHPRVDVRAIERALESPDRGVRAHGLEFLDALTRSARYLEPAGAAPGLRLREAILLAYEDLPAGEKLARIGPGLGAPRSAPEALSRMLGDTDGLLAACAAYHVLREPLRRAKAEPGSPS